MPTQYVYGVSMGTTPHPVSKYIFTVMMADNTYELHRVFFFVVCFLVFTLYSCASLHNKAHVLIANVWFLVPFARTSQATNGRPCQCEWYFCPDKLYAVAVSCSLPLLWQKLGDSFVYCVSFSSYSAIDWEHYWWKAAIFDVSNPLSICSLFLFLIGWECLNYGPIPLGQGVEYPNVQKRLLVWKPQPPCTDIQSCRLCCDGGSLCKSLTSEWLQGRFNGHIIAGFCQ